MCLYVIVQLLISLLSGILFFIDNICNWTHICLSILLSFMLSVHKNFIPFCKLWCILHTKSSFIYLQEKKIYSATWRDLPKTHKYYLPTRLLQNEFFTSSPHVFECFIHSHTVLTEGSIFQLTSSLAIALAQKSNRLQPGHFHMGDGKQVRHKTIELHFSALPHYHSCLSKISYNNYASF